MSAAAEPVAGGLGARLRGLARESGVYLIATALGRGIGLILVPLYANVMDPAEYGGLAVALSINGLLIIVLGLALYSAITRLHVEAESDEERGQLYLSITVFLVVVPGLLCGGLDLLGRLGVLDVTEGLPWDPILSLTLWASYLGIFIYVPQAIYINLRRPKPVLYLTIASAVTTVLATLWLVVLEDQGVAGALRALLISSGLMAVVSIYLVLRMSTGPVSPRLMKIALLFALPLIPHSVAQWMLNLSDRLVLERYVSAVDVGVYALGYQVGLAIAVFVSGVGAGLTPMILAQLKGPETRGQVPRVGTYTLAAIAAVCVAVAVSSDEVIAWIAPSGYSEAAEVAPWIVLGYGFYGAYVVWSHGTWYSMKTYWIPVITLATAVLNVSLNVLLVPRYGIEAAAVNTAVSFMALAAMHAYVAHRLYPIAWEWGRTAKVFASGVAAFALAALVLPGQSVLTLVAGLVLALGLFAAGLVLTRFPTERERAVVWATASRLLARGAS